jgi:hypothetical protein
MQTWHRWEDNIKMDLKEIALEGVEWIHLAQDRDQWQVLVKAAMNLWGNFLNRRVTVSFSRGTLFHKVS